MQALKPTGKHIRISAKLDKGHTCFMPRNTGEAVNNFLTQATTGIALSGIIKN